MRTILDCAHADTCLPDYWGGHHLPHVQIPVSPGMTLRSIKQALHSELNDGAVMGNDTRTQDDSGPAGDAWYKAAHAAVNRIRPARKGQRAFFQDIDPQQDDDDSTIYAYFVFVDV